MRAMPSKTIIAAAIGSSQNSARFRKKGDVTEWHLLKRHFSQEPRSSPKGTHLSSPRCSAAEPGETGCCFAVPEGGEQILLPKTLAFAPFGDVSGGRRYPGFRCAPPGATGVSPPSGEKAAGAMDKPVWPVEHTCFHAGTRDGQPACPCHPRRKNMGSVPFLCAQFLGVICRRRAISCQYQIRLRRILGCGRLRRRARPCRLGPSRATCWRGSRS